MALATWWRDDTLPDLSAIPGMSVGVWTSAEDIASVTGLTLDEAAERLAAGHRIYVASIDGTPVSYGWVATLSASIGELALAFALPDGDRYLWDFVTLLEWRGRGIYPRLLQQILAGEGSAAQRFWIIYAPENAASGSGIAKAGFQQVGDLSFLRDRAVGTVSIGEAERARLGSALLGVSLFGDVQSGRIVSPCWRCVLAGHGAGCWPGDGDTEAHSCTCIPAMAGAR